jgi:hypothetical protein
MPAYMEQGGMLTHPAIWGFALSGHLGVITGRKTPPR